MTLMQFIRQLSIGFCALCIISTAYAAYPLWTFTPDPNYPPLVSINSTQATFVVYSVQNQYYKSRSLVIKPTPGIVQ